MSKLTSLVLKRPVTTILAVLSLIFFGIMSLIGAKLELTPEINMPMLIVTTTYPGASPKDIDELINKEVEEQIGTLAGVDTLTSTAAENYGLTLLSYEYGTDMDNAYMQLRKKLDIVRNKLPEDASDPTIIEMDINAVASMYVCVNNKAVNNIYNYTQKYIVPEFEKIPAIASVDVSGGNEEYVSIQLIPEKLSQYRLNISSVAQLVGAASFTMPAGTTYVGNTDMTVSMGVEYKTVDELKRIPITTGNGNIIYLEDIANVGLKNKTDTGIGRYNGIDTVTLAFQRNQQYTAVDLSKEAKNTLKELEDSDPNLEFIIVEDSADMITNARTTMLETMLIAIAISTVILLLFYGDMKASLIVATSIPISILAAFVMIWAKGYSLNVLTLGAMVLAVGMMVDNSIVILESCFRILEQKQEMKFKEYVSAAISGSEVVGDSVLGSTLTTCVVFLPLAFLNGLTGQLFQPLSLTIVFSMIASLVSAISIVPLCFVIYKPVEKEGALMYKAIRGMQNGYREVMKKNMKHKKLILISTALLFVASIFLATKLDMKLMPDLDQGTLSIAVTMKPNLSIEKQDETYRKIEEIVTANTDVEDYMISSGGSSMMGSGGTASLTAYLKKDRERSTQDNLKLIKDELQAIDNCDISVTSSSVTSMLNGSSGFDTTLVCTDYDKLKETVDEIMVELKKDPRLTGVSSGMDNASPIIKIKVDPVSAAAEGFTPALVASNIYVMLTGTEARTMDVDGEEYSVRVEYPEEEYRDKVKVENILLTSQTGNTVFLKDIADIVFEDSPASINRTNKQYSASISADYTELAGAATSLDIMNNVIEPRLGMDIGKLESTMTKMMNDEFGNIFKAIAIAIFLVFVVMAAQFESMRFSFMVMTTIPFALIGSFLLLWLFDIPLTMPSLMGFIMLVGTVVNNGILYVDTVNQMRDEGMELENALIEAGAIRLRPILMTTLTTVLSMIPLALGVGEAGELMQGLAMVNIGGLIASTVMALLVLPMYYYYINGKKEKKEIYGR